MKPCNLYSTTSPFSCMKEIVLYNKCKNVNVTLYIAFFLTPILPTLNSF